MKVEDFYLVSLDVRPETDVESVTRLEHLQTIPLHHGLIHDSDGRRDIFQILAKESFTKDSLRWQGKERCRIKCHFQQSSTRSRRGFFDDLIFNDRQLDKVKNPAVREIG